MKNIAKSSFESITLEDDFFIYLFNNEEDSMHTFKEKRNTSFMFVLQQLLNATLNNGIKNLYIKGKVFELLSMYFRRKLSKNEKQFQYTVGKQFVTKIAMAKDIVIAKIATATTLQELVANELGLNSNKLKEGFKGIYGDTVSAFLINYRMKHAKKLLKSNLFNVNKVCHKIGYRTASYFIAVF